MLAPNMCFYTFPGQPLQISILVLLNGHQAFVVDAGFADQAQAVLADLAGSGITPTHLFNTHYNGDHIVGNHVFAGCEFLGSAHYQLQLQRAATANPATPMVPPQTVLQGGERMQYGDFDLEFIAAPGHTNCSINLLINGHILHAGDNIIRLLDGTDMVPFHMHVDSSTPSFLFTLQQMQVLPLDQMILSHAVVIDGQEQVQQAIADRLFYVRQLQALGPEADFLACTAGRFPDTEMARQWHQNNLRVLLRDGSKQ